MRMTNIQPLADSPLKQQRLLRFGPQKSQKFNLPLLIRLQLHELVPSTQLDLAVVRRAVVPERYEVRGGFAVR